MQVWYLLSSTLVPQMSRKLTVFQNRSSRVETAKRFWTLEDGTSRLSQNVSKKLPTLTAITQKSMVLFLSLCDYVRRLICMFHVAVRSAAGLIFINKAYIYFSLMNNKRFSWSTVTPCNYYMALHYCILQCVDHQFTFSISPSYRFYTIFLKCTAFVDSK